MNIKNKKITKQTPSIESAYVEGNEAGKNDNAQLNKDGAYGAEDNSNVQFDSNNQPIYVYNWNGQSTTKEEYDKSLASVYDTSKENKDFLFEGGKGYTPEQMVSKLQE